MNNLDQKGKSAKVPSGRLSRMTRLGSMAASVAGNMAVQGLLQLGKGQQPVARDLLLTPANLKRVADELAKMRGAAMKMGQLLSMDSGDVLPPELADILARLRADADFMPPKQLKQVLNMNWGTEWLTKFAQFNVRPIAAASIGQVHQARLKDGRVLAIKVQYPGISNSIDSDVSNVGRLIRMSGLVPTGFELAPYLEEARRQLNEEADYEQEAGYLDKYRSLILSDGSFIIPDVISDLSTKHILAMTYIEANPIEDLLNHSQDARNKTVTALLELTLRELFEFGVMQTDPNFANYRYDPKSDKIVLLDFGATRHLAPETTAQFRALLVSGLAWDQDGVEEAIRSLGLISENCNDDHVARILQMIAMVFSEICTDGPFDMGNTDLSQRLNEEGQSLAEAGFVPPPVPLDVLYIQRKLAGMFLLGKRLKAKVDLNVLLGKYLS